MEEPGLPLQLMSFADLLLIENRFTSLSEERERERGGGEREKESERERESLTKTETQNGEVAEFFFRLSVCMFAHAGQAKKELKRVREREGERERVFHISQSLMREGESAQNYSTQSHIHENHRLNNPSTIFR